MIPGKVMTPRQGTPTAGLRHSIMQACENDAFLHHEEHEVHEERQRNRNMPAKHCLIESVPFVFFVVKTMACGE
jgi:hypothetical protein